MDDDEITAAIERELDGLGDFPPGEWVTVNDRLVWRESTAFTVLITDENGDFRFTTPLGAAIELHRRAVNAPQQPVDASPAPDGPPTKDAPRRRRQWPPPGATS